MRPRTRLVLDVALLVALIAAYRPEWTGVPFHQWLSIAIVAPLLLHGIVNWEWTIRLIRTFFQRLLSMSRLNLVIDGALFLSAACVMVSGFMVSHVLTSSLGVHPTQPLLWHLMHAWSANATIVLLAVHAAAHWRWAYRTAGKLASSWTQRLATSAVSAGRLASSPRRQAPCASSARVGSRIGKRAAQAKAERAAAARALSVIGVTGIVGLTIFASVGLASEVLPAPRQANKQIAKAALMTCPSTGCTAARCHADYGKSAKAFYASAGAKRVARRKSASPAPLRRKARTSSSRAASQRVAVQPIARPKSVRAPRQAQRLMVCPQTGCSASSCHGTHHQSASAYYKTH